MSQTYCYDPTVEDPLSKVRGVGRYLQILRENFPKWQFIKDLKSIRKSNEDTIFINPFFNFLQHPLTLKRIAKKQVAVIHDLIPLKYPKHFPSGIRGKLNVFKNKWALKNYDLIVTDSHASKKDIIELLKIKESKVRVIYPCLPKNFLTSSQKNQADRRDKEKLLTSEYKLPNNYCLYVGDATWNKNLANLAKAIKQINVTCVLVGKVFNETIRQSNNNLLNHSWQREFKQFLNEIKNDNRFIFLGFVPDEKLIQLYQRTGCNLLISRDEGFGFSYLEAGSQSCPSILADSQVLREVSKNKGALFAKPENTNNIANAIGEVYFNQELRNKLGRQARERANFFSANKFKSGFANLWTY